MAFSPSKCGAPMLVLSEEEERLVEEIESCLDSGYPEERALVKERFDCLKDLGAAVSRYPSVRETGVLEGELRNEGTLVQSLCAFASPSHLLHIPVKVVAVRAYLTAKFQAFTMLSILADEVERYRKPLRNIIFSVVCTMVAEEVYFSCLMDTAFSTAVKIHIADDLISLWDSGTDPRSVHHLPALGALWAARNVNPPAFGTMNGTSELLRVSMDMGRDWHDFLLNQVDDNETNWALEEFLFGLSHEEVQAVRSRLHRFSISAVNHEEVRSFLGASPTYAAVDGSDPRSIYDFFIARRDKASFRIRIDAPGPKRTLEEIYIKYRIALE
jgi:hypothetical protein